MKCRKCGYLIEVRAAADRTESVAPDPPAPSTSTPAPPPARPARPRAGPLATSLASAKSPAKSADRPGPLASALKTAIQREEEVSAPLDMSDLSPSDEWYVAINGVPVGPIRIAEVRRKAAIGAVTEESLCWQEGLDEWRPLRAFPELAAIVREAFTSGRSSLTPPPSDGQSSLPPQQPNRTSSGRSTTSAGAPPPRPAPTRPGVTSAPPAPARNNVVPITSRLATAEKLAEEPNDLTRPFTGSPFEAIEPGGPSSVVPNPLHRRVRPLGALPAPAPGAA